MKMSRIEEIRKIDKRYARFFRIDPEDVALLISEAKKVPEMEAEATRLREREKELCIEVNSLRAFREELWRQSGEKIPKCREKSWEPT